MKIEDVLISQELERIRIRHGLDPVPFEPTPPVVDIDEDLTDIDQVERLFHASGLLVRDGRPVLAYIRDHTSRPLGPYPQPEQCNKVHFTVCNALKSMKTRGRFERYRVTSRDTNRYLVDIGAAWGRAEEREILLHPCQYCLGIIKYQQFDYEMPGHQKKYIVENFDVKELFGLLHLSLIHI